MGYGRYAARARSPTGQEDYDRLRPLSYPESNVVLICYAVDSPASLESVATKWIDEVVLYCPNVPVLLVACKTDLYSSSSGSTSDLVARQRGEAVAQRIGAYMFLECSAKTRDGVSAVFEHAARASLRARKPRRKRSGRRLCSVC